MAVKKLHYKGHLFHLNYEVLNPKNDKAILFLHGWGSNKEIMSQAFKDELSEYKHIYLDMPGFGKSTNGITLTTYDYKGIVEEFIKLIGVDPKELTIFGHSFGGKVATLLNPKNLVLLSSAGILEQKSLKVRLKIKLAKILGTLGFSKLTRIFRSRDVHTMSQNMYETFKNVVDEDFTEHFKNFKNNCLIFWGKKDTATKLDAGKKIAQHIDTNAFYDFDGDHYFFLKYHHDIGEICKDGFI